MRVSINSPSLGSMGVSHIQTQTYGCQLFGITCPRILSMVEVCDSPMICRMNTVLLGIFPIFLCFTILATNSKSSHSLMHACGGSFGWLLVLLSPTMEVMQHSCQLRHAKVVEDFKSPRRKSGKQVLIIVHTFSFSRGLLARPARHEVSLPSWSLVKHEGFA